MWEGVKDGRFTVTRLYNSLDGGGLAEFPSKVIEILGSFLR